MPESRRQLMIGGEPAALAAKLPQLEADPSVDVVQVQGAPEAPSLLVVTAPEDAQSLQERLGGDVRVEPDAPLDLF
jgi:ABC-type phosphate/phosphonate transport system substrate-binding protein